MRATRHNGRSGKNGTYNPKHNDRDFNIENSEHIDAERAKGNVYWDCYQGYCLPDRAREFNGNGYTAYQTKSTSGANGELSSGNVGGDYVVDARMQENDGTAGSWTRNVDDNTDYYLDGHISHVRGDYVRVQFSNDWNTAVSVQVDGSWRSN